MFPLEHGYELLATTLKIYTLKGVFVTTPSLEPIAFATGTAIR